MVRGIHINGDQLPLPVECNLALFRDKRFAPLVDAIQNLVESLPIYLRKYFANSLAKKLFTSASGYSAVFCIQECKPVIGTAE